MTKQDLEKLSVRDDISESLAHATFEAISMLEAKDGDASIALFKAIIKEFTSYQEAADYIKDYVGDDLSDAINEGFDTLIDIACYYLIKEAKQ